MAYRLWSAEGLNPLTMTVSASGNKFMPVQIMN
jgi:hypothetical protein